MPQWQKFKLKVYEFCVKVAEFRLGSDGIMTSCLCLRMNNIFINFAIFCNKVIIQAYGLDHRENHTKIAVWELQESCARELRFEYQNNSTCQ